MRALNSQLYDFVVFGGGAGGGKSFLAATWIVSNCISMPGSRWFMAREELKALKQSTLLTFFEVASLWGLVRDKHYTYRSHDGLVEMKNGSQIYLIDLKYEPSDPNFDRLGSKEYTGGLVEEAQEVTEQAVETMNTRIRFKLDEFDQRGTVLMTCNPGKGFLYTDFYKPFKRGDLDPTRLFIQSLATDNPKLPKAYVNKLKNSKNEAIKQRLLYGNWDYEDAVNQLIPYEWLEASLVDDIPLMPEEIRVGIDIANEGDDKSKIARWHDNTLVDIFEINVPITSQTDISARIGDEIIRYCQEHNVSAADVHLDSIGVGTGVRDYLRGKKFFINQYKAGSAVRNKTRRGESGDLTEYRDLRAYSYWQVRTGLQDKVVKFYRGIAKIDDLFRELSAHTYSITDKVVTLDKKKEVKKKIGRSPDSSDSVTMGYAPKPIVKFSFVLA